MGPNQERGQQVEVLAWHALVAGLVALVACLVTIGRADPLRPSLVWTAAFAVMFVAVLVRLEVFSRKMAPAGSARLTRASIATHAPIVALSFATGTTMYLSDAFNHQVTFFLQPTAEVLVLLAALATIVAEDAVILRESGAISCLSLAVERCSRWALPTSLVLLGLVQGSSYLWMIGNDFTRYWNVADAIRTWSGYPAMTTLSLYQQIGEPPYTIDLPGFPLLLLASFALVGHDTLAAALPNLVANAALPLLLFAFLERVGISRTLAFGGSVLLTTQPFFRLYTLNAPVPDAVFMAMLVSTTIAFQAATGEERRGQWLLFGILAGATALTRPEGVFFLAFMGLALLPDIRRRGPWIAAAAGLAVLLPFAVVMRSTFGFFWPNNAGSTMGLQHIGTNLYWLGTKTQYWYSDLLQLSASGFQALLCLFAILGVAGTIWLARDRKKTWLLPVGALVNVGIVFAVDQSVSGIHLWFDFFRHISYGLPYLLLAPLFFLDRLARLVPDTRRPGSAWLRAVAPNVLTILLLGISLWQMVLLTRPSQTYSSGGSQLLTSDIWVTTQDLAQHRYELPLLPHALDEQGMLVIEPRFDAEYLTKHLDLVRQFFEPYSVIQTNRGSQYEISSMLLVFFGAVFALMRPSKFRGEASTE